VDVRVADRLPPADDDFHLVSNLVRQQLVRPVRAGRDRRNPSVPDELEAIACFAQKPLESAACQDALFASDITVETDRGNWVGAYPPVYYAVMGFFAGPDIQVSALIMRLFTILLFLGITVALYALLPAARRPALLWTWLITSLAARRLPVRLEQPELVGGDRRRLGVPGPARVLRDRRQDARPPWEGSSRSRC
jgi:hypothetical protein